MPFLSKDWRDPGRLWIKTDRGWEEKLAIERMEMISERSVRDEELYEALKVALEVATQREALARKIFEKNGKETSGDNVSTSANVLAAGSFNSQFDDHMLELCRAQQERRLLEWEIRRRRCLMFERNNSYSSYDDQSLYEKIKKQNSTLSHEVETDHLLQQVNNVDDAEEQQKYNSDINSVVFKINVRERVQYIEQNRGLPFIKTSSETLEKNVLKKSEVTLEELHATQSASQNDKKESSSCSELAKKDQLISKSEVTLEELHATQSASQNDNQESSSCSEHAKKHQLISKSEISVVPTPPHCYITLKNTKEISGFNRLCDALKRLDFRSAAWDIQRFNYICKLIELLSTKRLRSLTGGSQKMLLVLLEEVARSVRSSQQNVHVLRRLVSEVQERLLHCLFWGKQLGSSPLWRENTSRLDFIKSITVAISVQSPSLLARTCLQDLPEECVREIMLRLTHHADLQRAGEAYSVMGSIVQEQRIWRELCRFHWCEQQIQFIQQQYPTLQAHPSDYKLLYNTLKRSFGLKEEFAVSLVLCRACQCLFWASLGHPCSAEQDPDRLSKIRSNSNTHSNMYVTISPHTFLSFFS